MMNTNNDTRNILSFLINWGRLDRLCLYLCLFISTNLYSAKIDSLTYNVSSKQSTSISLSTNPEKHSSNSPITIVPGTIVAGEFFYKKEEPIKKNIDKKKVKLAKQKVKPLQKLQEKKIKNHVITYLHQIKIEEQPSFNLNTSKTPFSALTISCKWLIHNPHLNIYDLFRKQILNKNEKPYLNIYYPKVEYLLYHQRGPPAI